MLWASDWPHTGPRRSDRDGGGVDPFFGVEDALILSLLTEWTPDEAIGRRILVDNPAPLYGF